MEEEPRKTFTGAPDFGEPVDAKTDLSNTDDYEFAFASVESNSGALTGSLADEIFSDGRILPVYPVFNQSLMTGGSDTSVEENLAEGMGRLALPFEKHDLRSESVSSSAMSSEAEDLEDSRGNEAEYCIWTPKSAPQSPDRWRKSSSTGSVVPEFRRFRLRDLVIGRSRSDGKANLFHLPEAEKGTKRSCSRPNTSNKTEREVERKTNNYGKEKGKGRPVKELDVVTAHRIYYGKHAPKLNRSFLPYRQDLLIGFLGHRNRNPFMYMTSSLPQLIVLCIFFDSPKFSSSIFPSTLFLS